MSLKSWNLGLSEPEPPAAPSQRSARTRVGGAWSLLATLDQVSAELVSADEELETGLHGELLIQAGCAAREMRARGKWELADALHRVEGSLERIAAIGAVRKAELAELGRIARELPSLLFTTQAGRARLPRQNGPALARAKVRRQSDEEVIDLLADRTVVIVNEDREISVSQQALLQAAGARVRLAYDGQDALALSRQIMPEVIMADAFMSGLDGVALVRIVRRSSLLYDTGIVLVGARRGLLDRLERLRAGADEYLLDKADATTVRRAVTRSIEPRLKLEALLQSPGEVRGSLASISARTLLSKVAYVRPEAVVTMRNAGDVFVSRLIDRNVVEVTHDVEGKTAMIGREALRKCLALRHGDFVVA